MNFILLFKNVKMPTIVGILTFISRINDCLFLQNDMDKYFAQLVEHSNAPCRINQDVISFRNYVFFLQGEGGDASSLACPDRFGIQIFWTPDLRLYFCICKVQVYS